MKMQVKILERHDHENLEPTSQLSIKLGQRGSLKMIYGKVPNELTPAI